jgi:hypothetical protein
VKVVSENIREKWEKFNEEAKKKLRELEEAGKNWIDEFDKMEQTATGLIMEIQREMKDSSEEAKKVWIKQLKDARTARQQLRANLEKRLDAVKRSEEHIRKAIDELTK